MKSDTIQGWEKFGNVVCLSCCNSGPFRVSKSDSIIDCETSAAVDGRQFIEFQRREIKITLSPDRISSR